MACFVYSRATLVFAFYISSQGIKWMLDPRFNLIISIPIILLIFTDLLKLDKSEYSLNIVIKFLSFA